MDRDKQHLDDVLARFARSYKRGWYMFASAIPCIPWILVLFFLGVDPHQWWVPIPMFLFLVVFVWAIGVSLWEERPWK